MIDKLVNFIYDVYKAIRIVFLFGLTLFLIVSFLPMKYRYFSEIKLGDRLIEQINLSEGNLPEDDDWFVLERIGFQREYEFEKPRYNKVSEKEFELVYLIGFDGPHLVWNSKEKVWKKGFPKR